MRFAPLVTAFTLAAGLVGFSTLHGQPPAGKADKSPAAELAKFRGEWTVTKIDIPPGLPGAPPEFPMDVLKGVAVSVEGERVTVAIRLPGERPEDTHFLLKVDPSKSPAHIDLTDATPKFEVRKTFPTARTPGKEYKANEPIVARGIYKFEGNELVLAFPSEPEFGRAGEFKVVAPKNAKGPPTERAGIALLRLTKKK